jgi:hypothetical protein
MHEQVRSETNSDSVALMVGGRAVPVADPGARVLAGRGPLITLSPQQRGHLGLQRALPQQLGAQPRHPLDRGRQILAACEHRQAVLSSTRT